MSDLKKEIKQVSELISIAEEFNLFDESTEGRQLKSNFFKQNEELFKQIFRQGEINKYPELYRYFFLNTKLPIPKIYSDKNYEILVRDDYDKDHIRNFRSVRFRWCKAMEAKKYSNYPVLEYLPKEISETISCFCRMCNLLGSRIGKISFYCKQSRRSRYGVASIIEPDNLYFIVSYQEENEIGIFQYNIMGDLKIPCEYRPCYAELYTDKFSDVRTTDLDIDFRSISSETKSSRLTDINEVFEQFVQYCPTSKSLLNKKMLNINMTSLAVLREIADYFNLVILPVEYSKFRLSNEFNKVVNHLGNCNVFVITTLDQYDPWGEIIDEEEPKSKFFPTNLFQLELSIQFSVSSQKILYKMLSSLEKRVDDLENVFNKNMRMIEKRIRQLRSNIAMLQVQIDDLAMKLMGIEWRNISSNKGKFGKLEEEFNWLEEKYATASCPPNLSSITDKQNKLIEANQISETIIQSLSENINLSGINFEAFKLDFINKKYEIEDFRDQIDIEKYMFIYTTANDLYQDAIAYIYL